jgi:hypothetical protein
MLPAHVRADTRNALTGDVVSLLAPGEHVVIRVAAAACLRSLVDTADLERANTLQCVMDGALPALGALLALVGAALLCQRSLRVSLARDRRSWEAAPT